jgi:predicted RNA-binding protein with RPS1 domain
VIGSGGSVIKDIIEKSGAEVNVEEDKENKTGVINVSSPDQAAIDRAVKMIEDITREVKVDDEFDGTVTRVEGYGIFVEFLPGREGLVHVSNMSTDYVKDANDLYKVDDQVHVRVKEYNPEGKIALTMLTAEQEAEQKEKAAARGNREDNGRGNGGMAVAHILIVAVAIEVVIVMLDVLLLEVAVMAVAEDIKEFSRMWLN